jgi:SAM-dependent methyltransferase
MWFDPEELQAQQAREIAAVEGGSFSGKGHFGSYYALLKGLDSKLAGCHSTVNDRMALSYARELAHILGPRLGGVRSILDVGSGVGAITNSLKRVVSGAAVTGLDIAEAGVAYATEHYPACRFICAGIGGDTDLGSRFDLIHCKGFLPFVRTSDLSVHVKYLGACIRHLTKGGLLVLVHPNHGDSVDGHISEGRVPCQDLGISRFETYNMSLGLVRDLLPYRIAAPLSLVASRLFGRHLWRVCVAVRT